MSETSFLPAIENASPTEILTYQNSRLTEALNYLSNNSPFYQEMFLKNSIDPSKIRTIKDLINIPVTTKYDLQQRNEDFLCVPKSQIIDFITTSGTLGDPVTFAMTNQDLDRLAYNEAISFTCADGRKTDIYQLMTTIDRRFMAGLAYFLGIRMLGAGIVRVGNGIPELQWDTIQRIKPNAIIAVPSFILKIIEYAELHKIDYRNSSVKRAVCIGEPLRNINLSLNTLGRKIKEKWPIHLYSTYASTEMGTTFTECSAGTGGHHHPELIIVEFLDDDDRPVKEGELGEVTVTTLGVQGMPLLRFKTGDICYHYTEPCSCGRNTMRLGPVIGRKNQMIKYKGTTLFPPALYDILDNIDFISSYVVEVFTNQIGTDEILIHIGSNFPIEQKEKDIKDHFRAKLRVAPLIKFQTNEAIGDMQSLKTSRKPIKFIDNRDK
ncbi:MAG: AMP-binding protein [Bacteroidales bacterium]|nr:AMP-binding protein [Bacteroidales bacterium]MDD4604027.1 AMP-binding protein [Bacteroidales bacterium]